MATRIASLYAEVSADTTKLQSGLRAARDDVDTFGKRSMDLKATMGAVATGVGLFTTAVVGAGVAAREAWQYIGQGAELNAAKGRFDNLTESIGVTSDAMMRTLREATSGMVSDAELVTSATDIISLGLAGSEEDVARLATVISTLGLDMQQVILTFANNSTMRLDALGLSVEGVTEKARELEEQGFQGDAFDEAVIISLEEKMNLLGDASETTAGKMQIVESGWENMTDQAKQIAAGVVEATGALDHMAGALDVRTRLGELLDEGTISFMEYEKMLVRATLSSDGLAEVQRELSPLWEEHVANMEEAERAAAFYRSEMEEMEAAYIRQQEQVQLAAEGADLLFQNYDTGRGIVENLGGAYGSLNQRLELARLREEELKERNEELNTSLEKSRTYVNDAADRFLKLAGGAQNAIDRLIVLRGKLDDMDGRNFSTTHTMRWERIGEPPPIGQGGDSKRPDGKDAPQSNADKTAATGLSNFVVPAGYPNDSYMLGLTSGEKVNVQTPDGRGGSGGHTINIYVTGGGRGAQHQAQQIATAVTDALGRLN